MKRTTRSYIDKAIAIAALAFSTTFIGCGSSGGGSAAIPVPVTNPYLTTGAYGTASGGTYYSTIQVTNQQQFILLLQYANLCNPYSVGINYGTASCSYWTEQGGFIAVTVLGGTTTSTTNVSLDIGAGSLQGQYIHFTAQATEVPYNNSAGMQIIGVTSNGVDQGLRILIPTGQFGTTGSIQGTLRYQNVDVGTVNLQPGTI